MSQPALMQVLRQLPISQNRNVAVNSSTLDDAGVYRLDRDDALVQTVDFFTPIVDDPFRLRTNRRRQRALGRVRHGRSPAHRAQHHRISAKSRVTEKTIVSILRGGLAKAAEVGCAIIGGHSIRNREPIYGLAVTGMVDLRKMLTNANARPATCLF